MKKERDYTIHSIVQAVEVLDALAERKTPLTLSDIVKATGLSTNTAFRVLTTLESTGTVEKAGDHYRLGFKLALLWARYKSGREAERDAIERELKELEIAE